MVSNSRSQPKAARDNYLPGKGKGKSVALTVAWAQSAKQKTSGRTMSMGMGRAARMAQAKAKGFLKAISEPFGLYFQQPSLISVWIGSCKLL